VIDRWLDPATSSSDACSACAPTGTNCSRPSRRRHPTTTPTAWSTSWNAYQCMVTFNMSRSASFFESGISRGMGFRDSNQDLLGFVHMVPGARARAHPRPRRDPVRQRRRLSPVSAADQDGATTRSARASTTIRSGSSSGVAAYLKETGDTSILDEPVPLTSDGGEPPLYEHLERSLSVHARADRPARPAADRPRRLERLPESELLLAHPGRVLPDHGEPARRRRRVGIHRRAVHPGRQGAGRRSRRLGRRATRGTPSLPRRRGEDGGAATAEHGWDGEWFLRAYDHFGNPVGSAQNAEGGPQIFESSARAAGHVREQAGPGRRPARPARRPRAERTRRTPAPSTAADQGTPSGWSAGAARHPARRHAAPAGVHEATTSSSARSPPTRRATRRTPSVFCHTNPWIMIAAAMTGRRRRGLRLLQADQPLGPRGDQRRRTAASPTSTRR
jgi:cellobiose phosphorylase